MRRVGRGVLLAVPAVYACWMGMMAVHEAGHVLHAWLSGGVVDRVSVPPLGFSQTFYAVNPRPGFVAWGGAVWGCLIPLVTLGGVTFARRRVPRALRQWLQFFAGFCLVANGVYLGAGWTTRAGDAGDLLDHGTPAAALVAFGLTATGAGLYLWHRLGLPDENAAPPA